jgi:hypothetical protein
VLLCSHSLAKLPKATCKRYSGVRRASFQGLRSSYVQRFDVGLGVCARVVWMDIGMRSELYSRVADVNGDFNEKNGQSLLENCERCWLV